MVKNMNRKSKKSFWIKFLVSCGAVLIIAGATTIVLLILTSKSGNVTVQSSQAVLDKFTKQEGSVLKKAGYSKVDAPYSNYLFDSSPKSYSLYIPVLAGQYVKYQNKNLQTNPTETTNDLESFLKGLNLKPGNTTKLDGITLKLFDNDKTICQTSNIQSVSKEPATYVLVCLDKASVSSEYKNTDALLSKASADIKTSSIKSIAVQEIIDNNRQLSILTTANKDNSSSTLYFLSTGAGWSYIGLRPTPSVDDKNSYTIPVKLQQAINNSSAKDLLQQYIQ